MIDRPTCGWLPRLALLLPLAVAISAYADSEFRADPTWQPVAPVAVYERLAEYMKAARIAPDQQAAIHELWQSTESKADDRDVLDRLAQCLAKTDDRVMVLVDFCSGVHPSGPLPEFAWLADSEMAPFVRNNMRLYLARWLVQEGYYDEAVSWTDGLTPNDVVSPAALLFYRAVAHHRLVQPDEADAALGQLLQSDQLPLRYQKLADLMQQDLAALEDDSLDHISRRMEDVRRRLAQGRSDDRVQQVENGVVESLKKLIKQAEDQMQQAAQAAAQSGGGQQSQSPMQDSQIAELKAPGDVEHRDIGRGSGWGNLPDKEREKAMQDVSREFPSHYREVIEEYFRRLAAEEPAENP